MSTNSTPPSALELVEERQRELGELCRKLQFLRSILASLKLRTRGKPFRIWNNALWSMILGDRDMLVIRTASWAKAAYTSGGLFNQLKADTPALSCKSKDARRPTFAELFPSCEASKPAPSDVDGLKNRFEEMLRPVVEDRDAHRAHAYEKKSRGDVKMIHLDELAAALDFAQKMLNQLRLIVGKSAYGDYGALDVPSDRQAEDLVDQILFGTVDFMVSRFQSVPVENADAYLWRRREAYYDAIHRLHDEAGASTEVLFNDVPSRSETW